MTDHGAPNLPAVAQSVAAGQDQLIAADPASVAVEYDHLDPSHLIGSQLVVDSLDDDSAFDDDDDASSVSASLTPSVSEGNWEKGRRYHSYKSAKYFVPNDDEEQNRLELQHQIWYIVLSGRLYLAPLDKSAIRNALDLGCGTGSWAIDFADTHPNCQVLGTDLSPIQPSNVPPNCSFMVDDAGADWAFSHKFDYIHTRSISSGIRDWDRLLEQAFENLRPGGWVELHELHMPIKCDDGTAGPDSAIIKWSQGVYEATKKFGIDMLASLKHAERLRERGFVGVEETHIKWPIGPWPKGEKEKKIGFMFQQDIAGNLRGISQKIFTQILGQSDEEFDKFITQTHDDMMNPKIHAYFPVDIFWAQKPLDNV
ncbi:S-adenosyl-L-methionine-dependent methyltransferase [Lepidopterella palustris CBS 459.81]|uniref:S-adenosyl-L-methionine-dependent methyltransferase n=1 Tax=Lepidopterella palustris CBS 459.81 TaxID=1314670 RepID=A0A8E2DWX7_9PEZI|nr:S-adenosyl-L-methionine-dependent methyltransferase [Lepidopterella palustris CBS 459.81]